MKNTLINNKFRKGSKSEKKFYLKDIELILHKNQNIFNKSKLDYINGVTTIDKPYSNRIIFVESLSEDLEKKIRKISNKSLLIILPNSSNFSIKLPFIKSSDPRMTFSKIVSKLFQYNSEYWDMDDNIHCTAEIGKNSKLMKNVYVGKNSFIGKNCIIHPNVYIGPNTVIGDNVLIRPGSSIGHTGFGFWRNEKGKNTNLPHVGGVVIGDDVVIGSLNSVVAGAIHPTVVENNVVTDDHVHIAHNCYVAEGVQFAAGTTLSGSVSVGKNVFFGTNSTVGRNYLHVGDFAFIGSKSNVLHDVAPRSTVAGNPARELKK